MTPDKIKKQIELLCSDLERCDKRCRKISKAIGLEDNHLISWARKEAESVLEYIELLKEKEGADKEI
jgi:hypothetical protein